MKLKPQTLAIATLMATALIGCKSGGVTADPNKTYTLKYSDKVGSKYVYESEMQMEATPDSFKGMPNVKPEDLKGPQTMSVKTEQTYEVTKVDAGNVTEKITPKLVDFKAVGVMKGMEQMIKMSAETPMERTVDAHGNVQTKGTSSQPDFSPSFPDKPVKIGDTWDSETKATGQDSKFKVKFLTVESMNGKEAVKLEVSFDKPPTGVTISKPIYIWIDPTSGRKIRSEGEIIQSQGTAKVTMKMSETLKK